VVDDDWMGAHAYPSYTILRIPVASLQTSLAPNVVQLYEQWGASSRVVALRGCNGELMSPHRGMSILSFSGAGCTLGGH
jgi:hypothetical protein